MSIRVRLSVWYTTLLGTILVLFGLTLYLNLAEHAPISVDQSLSETAHHLVEALKSGAVSLPLQGKASPLTVDQFAAPGVFVQVVDALGMPVDHSSNLHERPLHTDSRALEMVLAGQPNYATIELGQERVRVYSAPLMAARPMAGHRALAVVQVGIPLRNTEPSLDRLRWLLTLGSVGALLVAGAVGWAIDSTALRPIADIAQRAQDIALSRSFGRRLPTRASSDEVSELSVAFNEMLESLQETHAAQNRFIADVSRDLRTPLATIQGGLERLERAGELSPAERAKALFDVRDEIRRLSRLVSDLLTVARGDAGQTMELAVSNQQSAISNQPSAADGRPGTAPLRLPPQAVAASSLPRGPEGGREVGGECLASYGWLLVTFCYIRR